MARASSWTAALLVLAGCHTTGPDARLDRARAIHDRVLVLDAHEEHFEALEPELAQRFVADARRAARAIRAVTDARRINYALLANQVNHLHLHLFPRGGADDPDPRVSPWELALPEPPLPAGRIASLVAELARTLESGP